MVDYPGTRAIPVRVQQRLRRRRLDASLKGAVSLSGLARLMSVYTSRVGKRPAKARNPAASVGGLPPK